MATIEEESMLLCGIAKKSELKQIWKKLKNLKSNFSYLARAIGKSEYRIFVLHMLILENWRRNRNLSGSKPRISIGLPVFNGEKYLKEAVDSILAQTYSDFELLISINASTDHTQRICREQRARRGLDSEGQNFEIVVNIVEL